MATGGQIAARLDRPHGEVQGLRGNLGERPWSLSAKVGVVLGVLAATVGALAVANRVRPCIVTRRGTHRGQAYRIRSCWDGGVLFGEDVKRRGEVLVDGTWIGTYEFWNVDTDSRWESAASFEAYMIALIDDALAGRQYRDGRGALPSSPHYFEYDPAALARSKLWKAEFGHT